MRGGAATELETSRRDFPQRLKRRRTYLKLVGRGTISGVASVFDAWGGPQVYQPSPEGI